MRFPVLLVAAMLVSLAAGCAQPEQSQMEPGIIPGEPTASSDSAVGNGGPAELEGGPPLSIAETAAFEPARVAAAEPLERTYRFNASDAVSLVLAVHNPGKASVDVTARMIGQSGLTAEHAIELPAETGGAIRLTLAGEDLPGQSGTLEVVVQMVTGSDEPVRVSGTFYFGAGAVVG